mmetsp:Transcript_31690/g.49557  ORF Transcript_31690/g.49557 Transcript_31690/m.49557 type:complete len:386 (-) Transcript_31690:28-1185(-)
MRKEREETPPYGLRRRLGTVVLPTDLVDSMESILEKIPRRQLQMAGKTLSDNLRGRTRAKRTPFDQAMVELNSRPCIDYTPSLAAAYVAHRMPGVYGCTYRLFEEIKKNYPGFQPKTMLDFGSGPGTTIWAASEVWRDLAGVTAIERSSDMIDLAIGITKKRPQQVTWRKLLSPYVAQPYDIVVASYSLSELQTAEDRKAVVTTLWNQVKVGGVLALVEPGTPIGFGVIKDIRSLLLKEQFSQDEDKKPHIIAPCTHSHTCPLAEDRFCHFPQRMQRVTWQLAAKQDASRNYEDEKFSFIVFRKGKGEVNSEEQEDISSFARVISQPKKRGKHTHLSLCQDAFKKTGFKRAQIKDVIITKSTGRLRFHYSRKAKWGDLFREELPE